MRGLPPFRRPSAVRRLAGERGAILVQTAAMLVGLTALSAFVVDYGILWTARRQIQNTADAAAMAAALSLAFDAPGDQARARANAFTAVNANKVWGQAASIEDSDVTFSACPSGSVGLGACVRVQVFRNEDHQSALPTVFGSLVGVAEQGVRATATAQVLYGDAADCVKPVAVPDSWNEQRNNQGFAGWDPLDTFERYRNNGQLLGGAVDVYVPPAGPGNNGTGYTREASGLVAASYGVRARFEPQRLLNQPAGDRQFIPVRITPTANGPMDMLQDFSTCAARTIRPGMDLQVEPANATMPTREGVSALIELDPNAYWNPSLNGGRGGVAGGCMASGDCNVSPRIVPLVAFNPDAWDLVRANSSGPGPGPAGGSVVVTRLLGFFVEDYEAPYMGGRFMGYPAAPRTAMTSDPRSSFIISVALVR